MRIFVVGPHWHGQWTEYCVAALQNLGHEVSMFYYDRRFEDFWLGTRVRLSPSKNSLKLFESLNKQSLKLIHRQLLKTAKQVNPDLILLLKGVSLPYDALAELKAITGATFATWWLDDPMRYEAFVPVLPLLDYFFSFDRAYIPRVEEHGVKTAVYLPCACAVDFFHSHPLTSREQALYGNQISFVGTYYPQREEALSVLESFDLGIWGVGWQRRLSKTAKMHSAYRGRAMPQKAGKIYQASDICINIHHEQTIDGGLNFRTFELTACNAFQIVDYVPGIEELFDVDKEIICFHDYDELRWLVRYYLDHEVERRQIAERGHKRFQQNHTIWHRMQSMMEIIQN